MTERTRKLAGTVVLLGWITIYSLLVMVLAAAVLPNFATGWYAIFYMVAGLAWVPPAMLVISWMHKR